MGIKNLDSTSQAPTTLERCKVFGTHVLIFISIKSQATAPGASIETSFDLIRAVLALQTRIMCRSRCDPTAS